MLRNINYKKLKKGKMKLIGTLALTLIISINMSSCASFKPISKDQSKDLEEKEIKKAYCTINVIGKENYTDPENMPHYTFFINKDGKDFVYATMFVDTLNPDIDLSVGHYTLFSKEIGEYKFNIDDPDMKYNITIDYINKTMLINKVQVYDNISESNSLLK